MICYALFEVEMHGLELPDTAALEKLRVQIKDVIAEHAHPSGYSNLLESDVEVTLIESAGK